MANDGFSDSNEATVTLTFVDPFGDPPRLYPANDSVVTNISTGWPRFVFRQMPGVEWYQIWIGSADYTEEYLYEWYPATDASTAAETGQGICDGSICTIPTDIYISNGSYSWWMTYWSPDLPDFDTYWNETTFTINAGPLFPITNRQPSGMIASAPTALTWDHDPNALWYQLWLAGLQHNALL